MFCFHPTLFFSFPYLSTYQSPLYHYPFLLFVHVRLTRSGAHLHVSRTPNCPQCNYDRPKPRRRAWTVLPCCHLWSSVHGHIPALPSIAGAACTRFLFTFHYSFFFRLSPLHLPSYHGTTVPRGYGWHVLWLIVRVVVWMSMLTARARLRAGTAD